MNSYTTAQIAKIINVHPNAIILYEKWGHIEEVKRKPNDYNKLLELLNEVEIKTLEVIEVIEKLIKQDEEG